MGLLDDLLYNASPDNGPGLFGYLNNGKTAPAPNPDTKAATADELAIALGLNNIGTTQNATVPGPSAPMAAPAGPAPQVPISTSNFTPPAAAAPAPMTSPVTAPQFGANPSPYLFPQSGALFGANLPAPAALPVTPAVANANAAAPANASADDDDDTPATPAQASPIRYGNVNVPRIGPAASFTPPAAATAPAPAPVAAAAPAAAPSPLDAAGNAIGDRLKASWQSMRHGGGLIGGLSGLVTGQRDDPQADVLQQQAASANVTAQALLKAGVAPDVVKAAIQPGNGELLKALLPSLAPQMYTQETDKDGNVWNINKQTGQRTIALQAKDDKFTSVMVKNQDGSESPRAFNTKTGEYGPLLEGANIGTGQVGDMNKSGSDYLATLQPKDQSIVKGLVNGTVSPPTSFALAKPYWQNMIAAAKHLDPTFDENNYAARHKMSVDLASSGNSTMGGILSNGESAFKHLAEYTNSVSDQGNASHNFPLGGVLAHVQNAIGNTLGGSDTGAKVKAVNDNLGHYGQESTKFYAGTGGGVEERMNALREMNAGTASGEEAAAYAEKEKGLMLDRLNSKLQEIRNTMGEEAGNRIIAQHMPDIQRNIDTINRNIDRLRGIAPGAPGSASLGSKADITAPTAPAAPATGKLGAGNYVWTPGKGLVQQ